MLRCVAIVALGVFVVVLVTQGLTAYLPALAVADANCGEVVLDEPLWISVAVTNYSLRKIQVCGVRESCGLGGCVLESKVPGPMAPFATQTLEVQFRPTQTGPFARTVQFFVDGAAEVSYEFIIRGIGRPTEL